MLCKSLTAVLLASIATFAHATTITPARAPKPAKCPSCGPFVNLIAYKAPNPVCAEAFGSGVFTTSTKLGLEGGPNENEGPCVNVPSTFLDLFFPKSFLFDADGDLTDAYVSTYSTKDCNTDSTSVRTEKLASLQESYQFFTKVRSARVSLASLSKE